MLIHFFSFQKVQSFGRLIFFKISKWSRCHGYVLQENYQRSGTSLSEKTPNNFEWTLCFSAHNIEHYVNAFSDAGWQELSLRNFRNSIRWTGNLLLSAQKELLEKGAVANTIHFRCFSIFPVIDWQHIEKLKLVFYSKICNFLTLNYEHEIQRDTSDVLKNNLLNFPGKCFHQKHFFCTFVSISLGSTWGILEWFLA